jgi:hypothetical protein
VRSNAGDLRSNAPGHFPAQARTCVHLARPCLNQAVQSTFERTSIAFERTCRGCYIFERLRLIIVPALERTSAAAAADPRQVCVLFLLFLILFNYLFVYLFILPLFIYLLVVFSFELVILFLIVY